jgi:AcrR family transcriptional regulator
MGDRRLRELALDATASLVIETGARELSLAAIAAHGGLDPAEVAREFPTLEALGIALAQRMFESFQAQIAEAIEDEDAPHAFALGAIRTMRRQIASRDFPNIIAALIGSLPHRPELRRAVLAERRAMYTAFGRDCADPDAVVLISAALDGLWFASLLEVDHIEGAERDALFDRLEAMVRGAPAAR